MRWVEVFFFFSFVTPENDKHIISNETLLRKTTSKVKDNVNTQ